MAVITNKNTAQTPLATGLTGTQAIKFINADRVYIKSKDTTSTPVTTVSNGTTPSGWTDLGIINGKVKVTYNKELKEVRTGIDQVLRATYAGQKTGTFEFSLSQFDDVVMQAISGLTASAISAGSVYQFLIGSEDDVVEKALLLVSQNKLDGKEWQFYHPNAWLSFNIEESGEETVVRAVVNLPMFTHGADEGIFVQSIFAV